MHPSPQEPIWKNEKEQSLSDVLVLFTLPSHAGVLGSPQVCLTQSCLRTSCLAVPSAWNAVPQCMQLSTTFTLAPNGSFSGRPSLTCLFTVAIFFTLISLYYHLKYICSLPGGRNAGHFCPVLCPCTQNSAEHRNKEGKYND